MFVYCNFTSRSFVLKIKLKLLRSEHSGSSAEMPEMMCVGLVVLPCN